MKIHPLRHDFSSVSSFFFVCFTKGVDELAALSHKTAACTHDIISHATSVNSVNRHDVFCNRYVQLYNLNK